MHSFPHKYPADASSDREGPVEISGLGLPPLTSAPPAEFDGPGDQWSPETLLVAAVADCFTLTFRAVARANNYAFSHLHCHAEGTLDRVSGVTQFTAMKIIASLTVPSNSDVERAKGLLSKAEKVCLVSNSLKAETTLEAEVILG